MEPACIIMSLLCKFLDAGFIDLNPAGGIPAV
jgi:hypothetical protein